MIEADSVHSTPRTDSPLKQPMFPPVAESVDSFSLQPARQPESENLTSGSRKPACALSRRLMLAGLAVLPAAIPAATSAMGADAELTALGKRIEPLVDAYYAAWAVWSPALSAAHAEYDALYDAHAWLQCELPAEKRGRKWTRRSRLPRRETASTKPATGWTRSRK